MTRRHFAAIAEAIAAEYQNAPNDDARKAITNVAEHLARVCADFNGRFDADRFLTACGIDR